MTTTTPIRTGLIGFGLSGQVFHAPFLSHDADYQLAAVVSSQTERVQDALPDVDVMPRSEDLIHRNDIDLVVITAPNDQHFPLAQAALKAGKHVLVEKPSVTRQAHIDQLTELATKQGLVFTAYQNRRFDGDFQYLKTLIESRELGMLRHLDTRFDRFRPQPKDRWREKAVEGGGIFWDLGPHLLDQVLALLGPPTEVYANLKQLRQGSEATDWFAIQLTYPDCMVSVGSTPFEAGEMRRFNAQFDGGSWHCWGLDPQEEALRAGQQPSDRDYPSAGSPQRAQLANGEAWQPIDVPSGDYRHFFSELAAAIHNGTPPPVTAEQARQLVYLLTLAEQSAAQGHTLPWNFSGNKPQ